MSKFNLIVVVLAMCVLVVSSANAWDLYVSTLGNGTVERFSSTGSSLGTFASGIGWAGDLGFTSDGNLFVTKYNTGLMRYDQSGAYLGMYGGVPLKDMMGSGADTSGNVYAVHRGEGSDLGMVTKFDSTGTATVLIEAGDNGMYETYTAGYGPDNKLYVTALDASNSLIGNVPSIYVYNMDGTFVAKRQFGNSSAAARDVAFYGGYLYFSSYWGGTVTRIALDEFSTGAEEDVLSGYTGTLYASGIGFGPDGNLYVANAANNTILKFSGSGVYQGDFASVSSAGWITFTPEVVPEPSSLLALGGGMMGVMTYLRRRRVK